MLLSIIIPVFNRQSDLGELTKTLSKQIQECSASIEIIVVDDCSTPRIKIDNAYVKVKRNNKNYGSPYSRHMGFKELKGKLVHFHDSDDSISETWLSDLIEALTRNPDIDILLTGRVDVDESSKTNRIQKYFHKHANNPDKIKSRLIYRNCMGPLGGVTFSRRVLEKIDFKPFASCQDWQMYIDAMEHAQVLVSRPDIQFIFNKTGDDRISHNPRKKILGHLQLAKITAPKSPFKKNIRLFYLYTCKQHIANKGGAILRFYKKNRIKIVLTYLVVSVYWRLT